MKVYLLRYNVFSVDDYFTLLIGAFDSKDRLNEVIEKSRLENAYSHIVYQIFELTLDDENILL